jgi:hypothetical protein
MDNDAWLSADDLVNCAQRQNRQVTSWQLERWRKADLIPRPRKRSLGRGKGFESRYPPGSCDQLVAVCDLHRTERRLDYLRFALWRQGFPIPHDALKKTLDTLAFRSVRALKKDMRGDSPTDAAATVAAIAMPELPRSKMGRAMRQHLANDALLQQVLAAMLQFSFGGGPVLDKTATSDVDGGLTVADLLIRAMGLDVAQKEGIGDVGPWLPDDARNTLVDIEQQGGFSADRLRQRLYAASAEELEFARAAADTFVAGFVALSRSLHATGAPEVFGWFYRTTDPNAPTLRARMVLAMLMARDASGDTSIREIAANMTEHQPMMNDIQSVLEAAPDLAPYLHPSTGQQALAALDADQREAVSQRIRIILSTQFESDAASSARETDATPEADEFEYLT